MADSDSTRRRSLTAFEATDMPLSFNLTRGAAAPDDQG